METLSLKLFAIQSKNVSVTKDGTNPHFRSKYMTLDNIVETLHPFLLENKLLVTHSIQDRNLVTRIHDVESKEVLDSYFPISATDPQKVGSEITYWKRYNLVALFNICADEDDDANSCSNNAPTSNETTPSGNNTRPDFKIDVIDRILKEDDSNVIDTIISNARGTEKQMAWAKETAKKQKALLNEKPF